MTQIDLMASPPPPPPLHTSSMPSPPPAIVTSLYGVSLRQLNIAVVVIIVLLAPLIIIVTCLKARRAHAHRINAARIQAMRAANGGHILLPNGQFGPATGLDVSAIQMVGKTYVFEGGVSRSMSRRSESGFSESMKETSGGAAATVVRIDEGEKQPGSDGDVSRKVPMEDASAGAVVGARLYSESECSVCLQEYRNGDVLRKLHACGHSFHGECIDVWLQGHASCPLCRKSVTPPPLEGPHAPETGEGGVAGDVALGQAQLLGSGVFNSVPLRDEAPAAPHGM
eukprot:TRINITY_DN320_c0_g1_i1.p1 TRINITY_DN320_c0_g1~~TRINITY_DN320_c0_g1_i1.p1  ORF type:complete len:283 (-),score=31.28 TRINITY_DN320_c0_g1_i1:1921-2769(-)